MLDKTQMTTILYENNNSAAEHVIITVDSIKPLLTHNPQSMGIELPPGKGSRIPEADVEAEAGVYRNQNGVCCLKGEAFRASLLGASSAWKAKGKKTTRSLFSHIVVVEELVELTYRDGTPIKEYVIDARRAIVQRQGIVRRRPRFDEWSATFTFEYDPQIVDRIGLVIDVLADAGQRMGVGDFRPAKNGPFGRFSVRSYSVRT
jgi:hypothetical protein